MKEAYKLILARLALFVLAPASILTINPISLAQTTAANRAADSASHNREVGTFNEGADFVITRNNATIVFEPYSSNIIRVTLSVNKASAIAAPGYGFVAKPSGMGWSHQQDPDGDDVIRSSRLVVRVAPDSIPSPHEMPRNAIYQRLLDQFFGVDRPDNNVRNDLITIAMPDGSPLVTLWRWSMYPNPPISGSDLTAAHKQLHPGYRVSATFDSPLNEHYYGLGQHQQGGLDLRDRHISCWHEYWAVGGESVCVPFMVSSRGYGFLWDNPSKTTVDLGLNQQNVWSSQIGDRVSFFIIVGPSTDEIYEGYRQLTGVTHLLPKAAYGYIQSKCIYPNQEQLMQVAQGYRNRDLPMDVPVVDFLHETKEGNMDLDPTRWPDPAKMNQQLHSLGMKTMISVWPHFATDSKYYDMLKQNGWFMQKADGSPDQSNWENSFGPDIDTTNPDAAKWYWSVIKNNYIDKYGFSYIWLDETEPDIDPEHDFFYIGSGDRFYNVYPYSIQRRSMTDSAKISGIAAE